MSRDFIKTTIGWSSVIFLLLLILNIIYYIENVYYWDTIDLPDDSTFFISTSQAMDYNELFLNYRNYFSFLAFLKLLNGNIFLIKFINIIAVLIIYLIGFYMIINYGSKENINLYSNYFIFNFLLFYVSLPVWRDIYIFLSILLQYLCLQLFIHKKKYLFLLIMLLISIIQIFLSPLVFVTSSISVMIIFLIFFKIKKSYMRLLLKFLMFFVILLVSYILFTQIIYDRIIYYFIEKGFLLEASQYGMEEKVISNPLIAIIKAFISPGLFSFLGKRLYYRYTLDVILTIGMIFYYYFFIFKFPLIIVKFKNLLNVSMIPHLYLFMTSFLYFFAYIFSYGGSVHIRKKIVFISSMILIYFLLKDKKNIPNFYLKYRLIVFLFLMLVVVGNIYFLVGLL